jgi:hypothetical protein
MSAQQGRIDVITNFLEVNRKDLPQVVVIYLEELLYMHKQLATATSRQTQEISDLRALLYGNPDAKHDRPPATPPQVWRQGQWVDA